MLLTLLGSACHIIHLSRGRVLNHQWRFVFVFKTTLSAHRASLSIPSRRPRILQPKVTRVLVGMGLLRNMMIWIVVVVLLVELVAEGDEGPVTGHCDRDDGR